MLWGIREGSVAATKVELFERIRHAERQRAIADRVGKNAKKALRKPNPSGTYVVRDRDQK